MRLRRLVFREQFSEGRFKKAEGKMQNAESRKQKADFKKQKSEIKKLKKYKILESLNLCTSEPQNLRTTESLNLFKKNYGRK